MHMATCLRLSGGGPLYCAKSATGFDRRLTLTIAQSGATLTSIDVDLDHNLQSPAPLLGRIGSDGQMTIPDVAMSLKGEDGTYSLLQWNASSREMGADQTLNGTALFDEQFVSDFFGPEHYSNQNSFVLNRR
jgi:hypothetical protein